MAAGKDGHGGLWQIEASVTVAAVEAVEAALIGALEVAEIEGAWPGAGVSVSSFEEQPGQWRVSALVEAEPERRRLAAALAALPGRPPEISVSLLAAEDWVKRALASHQPVRAGRYLIRGSHHTVAGDSAVIDLVIDLGPAFGTGGHASTLGCLLALDALAGAGNYARPLDLGCGSGILALAIARTWARSCTQPVLAVDIDAGAVDIARANAELNGVAGRVHCLHADGFGHAGVRRQAPYDLIVANILAEPLKHMATDLAAHLARRGKVVLSGLLQRQEGGVIAAYRRAGLRLQRRYRLDGWSTLVLAPAANAISPKSKRRRT
ncbi:MAG: 50S ribosomal protein L11 methyltransferase [Alphaproteobacteria bacterium]|jgi:ribosomal protein L11 methyltransferase|nr:50S ribosomal protein L11 methyltransferase [Alphaproteobacteria bacterium]